MLDDKLMEIVENWREWSPESEDETLDNVIAQIKQAFADEGYTDLDKVLDSLVEKKYQLRLEHNHSDMMWYVYYAGREARSLFDDGADWTTGGDTPTEAAKKASNL